MIERSFKIGVNAGFSVAPVIHVNQYDHDEVWYFTLIQEDGQVYRPSTGAIVGIKSDGNVIINSGTVNSSGQIVINETQQMTAAVGNAVYELVFDAATHGTANFIVRVEPKPGDNATVSDSDISLIEEAIVMGSRIVAYGSPLVATTASQMTNKQNVYVYTGSESGYTNGHWYYWNGSAWTDGGVYNAVAVNTDKTLSVENMAADGKATGDAIADLKNAITKYSFEGDVLGLETIVQNSYVTTTGTFESHSLLDRTDYVEIPSDSKLVKVFAALPSGGNVYPLDNCIAFYNSSKTFIGSCGASQSRTALSAYEIPDNAKYLVLNIAKARNTPDLTSLIFARSNEVIDGISEDVKTAEGEIESLQNNWSELSRNALAESNVECSYDSGTLLFKASATSFPYVFFNRSEAFFEHPSEYAQNKWIILAEYENGVIVVGLAGLAGYYLSYDLSTQTTLDLNIDRTGFDVSVKVSDEGFTVSANGITKTFKHEQFTNISDTFVSYRLGYACNNAQYADPCVVSFTVPVFDERITALEMAENEFSHVSMTDGGVINTSGEITTHTAFGYTDFIPVPKWANALMFLNKVTLSGTDYSLKDYEFATYDSTKTFISTITGDTTIGYIVKEIDANAISYVRINYGVQNRDAKECMARFLRLPVSSKWSGKTGDFLGDSLTEQNRFTSALTSLFGINVNNYGKSGTTISNKVANNTFPSRVPSMSTTCDFVFVMGGTNDWGLSAPLGTKTDQTASTFYGGLYLMFEALRSRFPTKPIFVSTITQRNWTATADQVSGIDSNNNGDSLEDFNEAIKYMAHRYGCVVMNGFGESGIAVCNLSAYTADNLHFNTVGGERFAEFVFDNMEQVTPY